jgi:hypothetical protein
MLPTTPAGNRGRDSQALQRAASAVAPGRELAPALLHRPRHHRLLLGKEDDRALVVAHLDRDDGSGQDLRDHRPSQPRLQRAW